MAKRLLHTCDISASTLTGPFGADVVDAEEFHITATMIRSGFDPDSIWVKARALAIDPGELAQPLLRTALSRRTGNWVETGLQGRCAVPGDEHHGLAKMRVAGSNAVRGDFPDHPKGRSTQKLMRMSIGSRPLLAQYRCPPGGVIQTKWIRIRTSLQWAPS